MVDKEEINLNLGPSDSCVSELLSVSHELGRCVPWLYYKCLQIENFGAEIML